MSRPNFEIIAGVVDEETGRKHGGPCGTACTLLWAFALMRRADDACADYVELRPLTPAGDAMLEAHRAALPLPLDIPF